jgi:1-acyl-sn-glycerol-3-phosphate acyltransferase
MLIAFVTLTVYFGLSPFGYLLFAVVIAIPTRSPARRSRRLLAIVCFAFGLMHDWLRITRVINFSWRQARAGLELPDGPLVIIANHPTLLDTTALGATVPQLCMVGKRSIYRRLLIKPLMKGLGYIEGPGTDPISTGRMIDTSVLRLQSGLRVLMFPEGTRSPGQGLHQFGRAAFEIACRARVPLVAVAVRCQPRWLSKNETLLRPPHPAPRITLTLLSQNDPRARTLDSRLLRQQIETDYRRTLGLLLPERDERHTETA